MKAVRTIFIASIFLLAFFLTSCGRDENNSSFTIIPAAPAVVSAEVTDIGQVTISWTGVPGAVFYNVYYRTTAGVTVKNGIKIAANDTTTSYVHNGLIDGASYHYVVTTVNNYGESVESAEVSAQLKAPVPPASLSAVAGDGMISLSWTPVSGAASYTVYGSGSTGVSKTDYEMTASTTSTLYTASTLTNGTSYFFVVTATANSYGESAESGEILVMLSASTGSVTISGKVQYEDKEYGAAGFTGITAYKPVRFAFVEVVNSKPVSGMTDTQGNYSITLSSPSAETVYVRVSSKATPLSGSPGSILEVRDMSGSLYSVPGSPFAPFGNVSANISIPTANAAAGAFNILDVLTSGFQFVNSLRGNLDSSLVAYWYLGNPNGTYYCTDGCYPGNGIYVLGGYDGSGNGDSDHYDDDVLWHEFGHFAAETFSNDDSTGGIHYLGENDQDLRLSWSEGWGNFFPGAVKTWLSTMDPSRLSTATGMSNAHYVDTYGSSYGISFDFGDPGTSAESCYASNEVAVAKVLLDIRNLYGVQAVWDTVSSYKMSVPNYPVNLEVFWDRWRSLRSDTFFTEQTALEGIFGERQILYREDAFEAAGDDIYSAAIRTVNVPLSEVHYLYKASGSAEDKDIVRFTAVKDQQFTIQTALVDTLRNGADTHLTVLDSSGNLLSSNDNWNGSAYSSICGDPGQPDCPVNGDLEDYWGNVYPPPLSSTITFVAPAVGTYYVIIRSSSDRPPSAGRYGTYTLSIASQQ